MQRELELLFDRMARPQLQNIGLIEWGCPIPSFGNLLSAKLATIGLNPSNREFVDNIGNELEGDQRRFHTLRSLGLDAWAEADTDHYDLIIEYCFNYFQRNPYDGWFKALDYIISGSSVSYYFPSNAACHLDLIPFATFSKWTELDSVSKNLLFENTFEFLAILLNASPVETVVLNGQTVINLIQQGSTALFTKSYKAEWTLPRKGTDGVAGFAYDGEINRLGDVSLNRSIRVLGYNHNIQSSFGVTKAVKKSIRDWVTSSLNSK